MATFFSIAAVVAFVLVMIVIKRAFDQVRIREYVEERGGRVVDTNLAPIGLLWFGMRERIYQVKYETHEGKTYTATCMMSLFGRIYWTNAPPGLIEGNEIQNR